MRKADCLIMVSIWSATVMLMDTKAPASLFFTIAALLLALAWFVAFLKTKQ